MFSLIQIIEIQISEKQKSGLSVILLEKNAMIGGHTALSGGLSIVTGSKIQKDLGVTIDRESNKIYANIIY